MVEIEIKDLISNMIGDYGWMLMAGVAAFLFKDLITNLASGFLFMWGTDFDVDDIVFIGGTKKARIIRQTMTKTVFYLYDTERKLVIPNKNLYSLKCEKILPTNGKD